MAGEVDYKMGSFKGAIENLHSARLHSGNRKPGDVDTFPGTVAIRYCLGKGKDLKTLPGDEKWFQKNEPLFWEFFDKAMKNNDLRAYHTKNGLFDVQWPVMTSPDVKSTQLMYFIEAKTDDKQLGLGPLDKLKGKVELNNVKPWRLEHSGNVPVQIMVEVTAAVLSKEQFVESSKQVLKDYIYADNDIPNLDQLAKGFGLKFPSERVMKALKKLFKDLPKAGWKKFMDNVLRALWKNSKTEGGELSQDDLDEIIPPTDEGKDKPAKYPHEDFSLLWDVIKDFGKSWMKPLFFIEDTLERLKMRLGFEPNREWLEGHGIHFNPNGSIDPDKDSDEASPDASNTSQNTPEIGSTTSTPPPNTDPPAVYISGYPPEGKLLDDVMAQEAKNAVSGLWDAIKGTTKIFRPMYYYVWWVFESYEEFDDVRQKHIYPRGRGQVAARYEEIPSKEIAVALSGQITESEVQGYFLGAMGLRRRKEVKPNNVPLPEPVKPMLQSILTPGEGRKGEPCIGYGVARAKRFEWRLKETRGLTNGQLMKFDVQKLEWKWTTWLGGDGSGKENSGLVQARTVTRQVFEEYKNDPKKLMSSDMQDGIVHDAEVSYQGKKKKESMRTDEEGFALFTNVPMNEDLIFKAKATGYKAGQHELPPNAIILNKKNNKSFAIIPMDDERDPKLHPEILLKPVVKQIEKHDEPFGPEFGVKPKQVKNLPTGSVKHGKAKNFEVSFYMEQKSGRRKLTSDEGVWYEVFIAEEKGGLHLVNWPEIAHGTVDLVNGKTSSSKTNDGKINTSVRSAKEHKTGYEGVVPSFDVPEGINGPHRIYCLVKKTPDLIATNSAHKSHLAAIFSDDYKDSFQDDGLLWDYNYVQFNIGPEVSGSTAIDPLHTHKSPHELAEDAHHKVDKAYESLAAGQSAKLGYSSKDVQKSASVVRDWLASILKDIPKITDTDEKDLVEHMVLDILDYIIAQKYQDAFSGNPHYNHKNNSHIKKKIEALNMKILDFLKDKDKNLFDAIQAINLVTSVGHVNDWKDKTMGDLVQTNFEPKKLLQSITSINQTLAKYGGAQ